MSSATLSPPVVDARALAHRAGDAEGLGHWDSAARLYALAFRASVLDRSIAAAADALRGQARVRNHQRRFDEAEELALLSLAIAEANALLWGSGLLAVAGTGLMLNGFTLAVALPLLG